MDAQTLASAMGNRSGVNYAALVGPCNEAMLAADVTTFLRAVLWCAQVGHESGGLQWMEEIADGSGYEGRSDLGNTQPGDGRRFKGRGPIQLTGRSNYREFSKWANARGLVNSATFFEDNPQAVSEPRWGFMAAAFFWSTRNINRFADGREVTNSTRVINGGTNGLQDRIDRYNQCFPLGDSLLPEEFHMSEAQDVQTQLRGPDLKGWEQLGGKSLVDAVADVRDQLGGPNHNWGGWPQLGGRTLVDAVGRILDVQEQILAILKAGK